MTRSFPRASRTSGSAPVTVRAACGPTCNLSRRSTSALALHVVRTLLEDRARSSAAGGSGGLPRVCRPLEAGLHRVAPKRVPPLRSGRRNCGRLVVERRRPTLDRSLSSFMHHLRANIRGNRLTNEELGEASRSCDEDEWGQGMGKLTESYWPADESVPLRDLTVGDLLREAAKDSPDVIGLVAGVPGDDRRWTFAEMLADAERVAAALLARFSPGERVAVWAPNLPGVVVARVRRRGSLVSCSSPSTPRISVRSWRMCSVNRAQRAVFLVREWRGNPMQASLEDVQGDLEQLPRGHPVRGVGRVPSVRCVAGVFPRSDPTTPRRFSTRRGRPDSRRVRCCATAR